MGGRRAPLLDGGLVDQHAIAAHDAARHRIVALPRRVGDDRPAVDFGLPPALGDGGVVIAVDPDHLGAARPDGGFLLGAGELGQEDHAAIAEQLGARGDGAPMVARAGGGEDEAAGDVLVLALHHALEGDGGMTGLAGRAGQHVGDRDHAAQRLEGAEAEALALVLDPDLAHAQAGGQGRQLVERRRLVRRAGLQLLAQFGNPVGIDHELLFGAEFEGARAARILGQPGGQPGGRHAGVIAC